MHKSASLLRRTIERSVFVAKHTAQVGFYLEGTETARLIAFTGPKLAYLRSRCGVHVQAEPRSSKPFLSDPNSLSALIGDISNSENIWTYEPYQWVDDLEFTNIATFSNSYFLFKRYSSKINQLRFFLRYGNDILRTQLMNQFRDFEDRLETMPLTISEKMVFYEHSHSEGGRGIRYGWKCDSPTSALTPIRIAQYCPFEMGISQAGTIFADGIICSQPARVWNGANGHPFSSSCTYYDPDILSLPRLSDIVNITRSVGLVLQNLGYRGAFGCDFLHDPNSGKIFISEANLRYTGDIALFCSTSGAQASYQNLLHPHSLHILSFLGKAAEFHLPGCADGFLSFEEQGGGGDRAFFDPGAPIKMGIGSWIFMKNSHQAPAPPVEYLSLPVCLGGLFDSEGRLA